jgi:hypothetical protein
MDGDDHISFADVNLQAGGAGLRGPPHNPGAGGWPTIRYYNKETGLKGKSYTKVTEDAMCTELGNMKHLKNYVEGARTEL